MVAEFEERVSWVDDDGDGLFDLVRIYDSASQLPHENTESYLARLEDRSVSKIRLESGQLGTDRNALLAFLNAWLASARFDVRVDWEGAGPSLRMDPRSLFGAIGYQLSTLLGANGRLRICKADDCDVAFAPTGRQLYCAAHPGEAHRVANLKWKRASIPRPSRGNPARTSEKA